MIEGAVQGNLDPLVQLEIIDANGRRRRIKFVVDTGFSGYLSFPKRTLRSLGLRPIAIEEMIVPTRRRTVASEIYEITVVWDGQERVLLANALNTDPLIGTALLYDHQLTARFVNGGPVVIERLV